MLIDVGGTTSLGLLAGGIAALAVPAAIFESGIMFLVNKIKAINSGTLLVNYYYLANNYPKVIENKGSMIFDSDGMLEIRPMHYSLQPIGVTVQKDPVLKALGSSPGINYGGYSDGTLNQDEAQALYSIANLFVAINNLDITQMKKNLLGFAYLKDLRDENLPKFVFGHYDNLTFDLKVNGQSMISPVDLMSQDTVDLKATIHAEEVEQEGDIFIVRVQQDNSPLQMKVGAGNEDWQSWQLSGNKYAPYELIAYDKKLSGDSQKEVTVYSGAKLPVGSFQFFVAYLPDAGKEIFFNWESPVMLLNVVKCLTPVPNAPVITVTVKGLSAAASWPPVPDAQGYKLHIAPYSNPVSDVTLNNIQSDDLGPQTSLSYSELLSGMEYYVAVTAYNCSGESNYSNVEAVLISESLNAPTNLSATAGNGQVRLSWNPVAGATSYNLYWNVANGAEQLITITAPPYTHTGLTNGTTYAYRMTAVNASGVEGASSQEVSATPQSQSQVTPGEVFRDRLQDGSLGPEMVWIPAGTFRMGDIQGGGHSDEQPVHEVSVSRFAMGRYEVTFAEYDKFAEATGREKPYDWGWGRGNRPVIYVSWNDATAYAEWLSGQTGHSYRLPTEAEWEYSARGGTETQYWWGNEIGTNKANCRNCGDSFDYTAPVGSFDANPFGIYDTAGNVWEWTCSEYENLYNGQEQLCVNTASRLSLRGGSWVTGLRAAGRSYGMPTGRYVLVGFRVSRL